MHHFLITIDVEDWFQVENLRPWNPATEWGRRELRVERNVHRLLDLFDSLPPPNFAASLPKSMGVPEPILSKANPVDYVNPVELSFAPEPFAEEKSGKSRQSCLNSESKTNPFQNVKATFFVLGWLAERLPEMVREIAARGHEVASHGYNHNLPSRMSDQDLRRDLIHSKNRLEDTIGNPVFGYRAPSFGIDKHILNAIAECGYLYDSSYNSFSLHGRYGKINLNGQPRAGIAYKLSDNFYEIPVSNLNLKNFVSPQFMVHGSRQNFGFVLPWSGGAYFRLLPFRFFRYGVQRILKRQDAYVFYVHPWEIDPNQPRVSAASLNYKFRHYTNLAETYQKLKDLIENFNKCWFVNCHEYLKEIS